jgi:hypothetical protein
MRGRIIAVAVKSQVEEIVRLASATRYGIPIEHLMARLQINLREFQLLLEGAGDRVTLWNGFVFGGKSMVTGQQLQLAHWVKHVLRLKNAAGASMYALGCAIGELYAGGLWKRVDGWEGFCRNHLHMSSVHANRLADVASNYTAKQIAAHGVSKLGLLLTAPPEARPKLLAKVARGASARDVADAVQREKRKADYARPARDGSKRHPGKTRRSHKIECPFCGMSWTPGRAVD